MQPAPTRIGLISDTHGLLRPQALEALRGSDLILHVGDVGKPEILTALRTEFALRAALGAAAKRAARVDPLTALRYE